MDQERLRKLAGMQGDRPDPEVMVQDFGGLPLSDVIVKIKQDAEKLNPRDVKKSDVLFIRNAAAAIAQDHPRTAANHQCRAGRSQRPRHRNHPLHSLRGQRRRSVTLRFRLENRAGRVP